MGGGELNCGQETPLASVDQSGSGPAPRAGAGRYSAVLNGIRPGACGGSASGLLCLPGATGTTWPPTESRTPEPGAGLGCGGERVNSSPAWHTRPFGQVRYEDEHLSGDEEPLGGSGRTLPVSKGLRRGTCSGAAKPQVARSQAPYRTRPDRGRGPVSDIHRADHADGPGRSRVDLGGRPGAGSPRSGPGQPAERDGAKLHLPGRQDQPSPGWRS